jgi:hypothetical protein
MQIRKRPDRRRQRPENHPDYRFVKVFLPRFDPIDFFTLLLYEICWQLNGRRDGKRGDFLPHCQDEKCLTMNGT